MRKKEGVLLLGLVLVVLLVGSVVAEDYCEIKTSCESGETKVMGLSGLTNAHGQLDVGSGLCEGDILDCDQFDDDLTTCANTVGCEIEEHWYGDECKNIIKCNQFESEEDCSAKSPACFWYDGLVFYECKQNYEITECDMLTNQGQCGLIGGCSWVGSYPYSLCCDGSESTTCAADEGNLLIRLSAGTNAHAEGPDKDSYPEDVCYSGLDDCRRASGSECVGDKIPILSLSYFENAHIGPSKTIPTGENVYRLKEEIFYVTEEAYNNDGWENKRCDCDNDLGERECNDGDPASDPEETECVDVYYFGYGGFFSNVFNIEPSSYYQPYGQLICCDVVGVEEPVPGPEDCTGDSDCNEECEYDPDCSYECGDVTCEVGDICGAGETCIDVCDPATDPGCADDCLVSGDNCCLNVELDGCDPDCPDLDPDCYDPGVCSDYSDRISCIEAATETGGDCTWTIPWEEDDSGNAGCCNYNQKWDEVNGLCVPTDFSSPCTYPWTRTDPDDPLTLFPNTPIHNKYCAQVASNIGLWYDIKKF